MPETLNRKPPPPAKHNPIKSLISCCEALNAWFKKYASPLKYLLHPLLCRVQRSIKQLFTAVVVSCKRHDTCVQMMRRWRQPSLTYFWKFYCTNHRRRKPMPPPGLSQAGHECLIAGASLTSRDWAAEMAPQSRLKDFKVAMLNFIVPSRRWALFMNNDSNDTSVIAKSLKKRTGISRTLALIVVATGDANQNVVDRATLSLKAHLDSMRERDDKTEAIAALGDPMTLLSCLLALVLGNGNAQAALSQIPTIQKQQLGTSIPSDNAQHSQLVLSLKSRMASKQTCSAVMAFVSNKVLDDNPQLLDAVGPVQTRAFTTLAVLSANRLLSMTGTSNLSTLRAAPYITAVHLLNASCVRLTTLSLDPPVDFIGTMSVDCMFCTRASVIAASDGHGGNL